MASTPRSIELLNRALAEDPNASAWARHFNLDRTTIPKARKAGRLSPVLAGQLAAYYGEPVPKWVALAALEGAKATTTPETLQKLLRTIVYVSRHALQRGKASANAR